MNVIEQIEGLNNIIVRTVSSDRDNKIYCYVKGTDFALDRARQILKTSGIDYNNLKHWPNIITFVLYNDRN